MTIKKLLAITKPTAKQRLQQARAISEGMRAIDPEGFAEVQAVVRRRVACTRLVLSLKNKRRIKS